LGKPSGPQRPSKLEAQIVGDVVRQRTTGGARSGVERFHECYEPVSLERKNEASERRTLEFRREEWLLVMGCPVNDQSATRSERERCRDAGFFECVCRHYRQRRGFVGIQDLGLSDGGCERNVVTEADQRLSETFEKRGI
jgi:hypothetical protein